MTVLIITSMFWFTWTTSLASLQILIAFLRNLSSPPFLIILKDLGTPDCYLGAKVGCYTINDTINTWFMSAESYLEKALPVIEERFGSLKCASLDTPAHLDYHPEMDQIF